MNKIYSQFKLLSLLALAVMLFTNCSSTESENDGIIGSYELVLYNNQLPPIKMKYGTLEEGVVNILDDGTAHGKVTFLFYGEIYTVTASANFVDIGDEIYFEFPILEGDAVDLLGERIDERVSDILGNLREDSFVISYSYKDHVYGGHKFIFKKKKN